MSVKDMKLVIATPFQGLNAFSPYVTSLVQTVNLLHAANIPFDFWSLSGDSYVERARNEIANKFMKSDFTHLLFIDSDMSWNVIGLSQLLKADVDVVGAGYPCKNNWGHFSCILNVNKDQTPITNSNGLISAWGVPTGFMKIRREVFVKLAECQPDNFYRVKGKDGRMQKVYNFFGRMVPLGEDISFCRRWVAIGGELWVEPRITLRHYGNQFWEGNYHEYLMSRPGGSNSKVSSESKPNAVKKEVKGGRFCDIIIPTYENEFVTAACIDSIKSCTKEGTYRIIWVDNGSKNTREVSLALEGVNHLAVRLENNEGFVSAVNKGISVSDAPFVCLLNNDTVVSTGWLDKLIDALEKNPKLGIVGPVTAPPSVKGSYDSQHCVSYIEDQAGDTVFPDYTNLEEFNRKLESTFRGELADVSFVAFLCAVIKQEVINEVGLLDTNFDMGLYDDNDYNLSARKAGFEAKLLYDTCIWHQGRTTFRTVVEKDGLDIGEMLSKNKSYLDSKWYGISVKRKAEAVVIALYPYGGRYMDSWLDHGAGMTYTAAKEAGCDVDFIDMKALNNEEELKEALLGYKIVTFGMKSTNYPIGKRIVDICKSYGSRVMVGGYHATAAPHELLEDPDISWVFYGESEITFPDFLKNPDKYPREIWGEKPKNLDELPFMNRDVFYNQTEPVDAWWFGGQHSKMVSVVAARGCPYQCSFCQPVEDNHFGKKLRRRSVGNLIEELKMLKRRYNPDCVMIHDDTFFIQDNWLEEFICKYPEIGLPFWASARADGLCAKPDLFNRLVKVGWDLVSVGFESGSQRMLDKMKKGTTVEQNYEAGRIIKASGAKIYGNYIAGLPWETKEELQATAKMVDEIDAEMTCWSFFTPYPGCELGEECIKNGLSLLDRNSYDRYPSGKKVKNVDYDYVNKVLRGLREEQRPHTML